MKNLRKKKVLTYSATWNCLKTEQGDKYNIDKYVKHLCCTYYIKQNFKNSVNPEVKQSIQ